MPRNPLFDSLKFILIVLVIYGHCIEQYCQDNIFNRSLYYFIYTFHMPLFIFISGYFSKKLDYVSTKNSVIKLFEIYVLSRLIWIIFINPQRFYLYDLLLPSWTFWYLLSLGTWKVISSIVVPRISKKYLLPISVLLCILIGFTKAGPELSISRSVVFYPFFLLGIYTDEKTINYIRERPKYLSVLIILAIFLLSCTFDYLSLNDTRNTLYGGRPYTIISGSQYLAATYRFISILISFVISICIINVAPSNVFLGKLGKNSILFYVYHALLILLFNKILFGILGLPINSFSLIGEAIIIILSIYILSKFEIFHTIINPFSFVLNKIRAKQ